MGRIDRFEDLEVWKISRELCQMVEHLFLTTELGEIMLYGTKWNEAQVQ